MGGMSSSPQTFRLLAEYSPDVIVRFDRQCRRTYVNPAFERVYGIPAELAVGKTVAEQPWHVCVTPAQAEEQQARLASVMSSGQAASFDLHWAGCDGKPRWMELLAVPEFGEQQQVVGAMTFARDVTAQRQALRELELLNFALDNVADALYLVDQDARILRVNQGACRMLGWSEDELLGARVFDIDPEFPEERWLSHWEDLLNHRTELVRSRHRAKDGRLIPVEVSANMVVHEGRQYNMALVRDISKAEHARLDMQRREQEFRALAELSPDFITRHDRQTRVVYANPAYLRQLGATPDDVLGRMPTELAVTGSGVAAFEAALNAVLESGEPGEMEGSWQARDGRRVTSHVRMTPEFGDEGEVASVLVVGRDITERKAHEERLERTEQMARVGHWEWDKARRLGVTSLNLCRLFGQPPGWSPSVEDTLAVMPDDDRRRVMAAYEAAYRERKPEFGCRYRSWTAHGKLLHFFTHVRIEYDEQGRPARLLGATQDISDIVHYESRLHEMTFSDSLTNLPNRAQLYDRLQQAVEEAQRQGNLGGLLLLDLDRFQEVNDTLGHLVGDRLLCLCAERLREAIGTQDVLARLGGDEFAILVPGVQDAQTLADVAQELRAVLARPFKLEDQELYMSASVGIAVFPTDAGSTTSLLQYADSALNEAKSSGRSCHRFYSAELTVKSHERVQLEAALRRALANAELEVHYQPKVALSCGEWMGAEALLRWRHPALGLLAPDRFIGIAEETGLIVDIGAWVLREACAAAVVWNRDQGSDFKVAVNLSAVQVQRTDVVATVREVLEGTCCKPRWLELEITESLLLGNSEAVRKTLRSLRDMGVSIAIDDFGTGYSSLAYLKRFPIDVLKIDRSFTRDIGQDHDSTELVKAIITMARSLRLSLVAEGVEDMTQARFLQEQGCALAQGYLYARPMPCSELMQAWDAGCVAARRGDCPALSTSDSWLSAGIRKTVPT